MLKRHGSKMDVLKRHGSSVQLLHDDVLEFIFEKLTVKPLLRFRAVSKKWKSTIDSRSFQERQLIHRRQSRGPDVLLITLGFNGLSNYQRFAFRIEVGSSIVCTVSSPVWATIMCKGCCDGLVCLYCIYEPCHVVNPATRWHQSFPLSNFQHLSNDRYDGKRAYDLPSPRLGFGKDKFMGTYKPVWLYNSSEFGLDNVTTCEVFDFSTNTWRYVVPASPCRINDHHFPVYLDGSLHWLTEGEEINLLSFDLHTETFQVLSKAPFAHGRDPFSDMLCILDNRLCVSERTGDTQVIWSFDSSGGNNKTWKKLYSLDISKTPWLQPLCPLEPIALLDENKLLFIAERVPQPLVTYDLHAKSFDILCKPRISGDLVCCFQSLFSVLSN